MQALRTRYGGAHVKAVINRFDRSAEISTADVEKVVGGPVAHVIPSDYRGAVEALNVGRPVVLGKGRLAESLQRLAGDLSGVQKQRTGQQRSASVLGRLAFRRA
jgi:Flp pilus assembly CpaE family ATPase